MNIMKVVSVVISSVLIAFFAFLSSCDKPQPLTPEQINTQVLVSAPWKINTVKVDGIDRTTLFTGMTLQFTEGTYTTTNGGPVWPASGTWAFTDANATSVKRSDDVLIAIKTISETSLVLQLQWNKTTFAPGRNQSIEGVHEFSFGK